MLVRAPAGYGKTSLLAQWAALDARDVAWLSLDRHDDDPVVLLTYLAAAIDQIEPLDPDLLRALGGAPVAIRTRILPALALAMARLPRPVLLVLDDVDEIRDPDVLGLVTLLAGHLPDGSQLALVARSEPSLPIARLRAGGGLLELGAEDLALDVEEAAALFAGAGLKLPLADVAELVHRTEGWPAGLYLAALELHAGGRGVPTAATFSDRDRHVEDFLRAELPSDLSARQLRFLYRTSVLDRMTAPLCDAVVGRRGSAAMLGTIERANLFLVPLDHERRWYRYHQLFRAMLRDELERREPGTRDALLAKAADWCQDHGLAEEALGYAFEAGDLDRAATLFEQLAQPLFQSGRMATLRRWLDRFDEATLDRHPAAAALAACGFAFVGEPREADRWLSRAVISTSRGTPPAAQPDGATSPDALVAVASALLCSAGVDRMLADATRGAELVPEWSPFRAFSLVVLGTARLLAGDDRQGRTALLAAADLGEDLAAHPARIIALAELAVLALERGEWSVAEAHAGKARSVVIGAGLDDYPLTALAYAVAARTMVHRGDLVKARSDLAHLGRIVPGLSYAIPWLAIQARLEMARAHLGLGEGDAARAMLAEIDTILERRPDVGRLKERIDGLRAQLDETATDRRVESLTEAELRLVPLLPTHLSFIEIAELHVLSPNTVKTQAISIYRKLGASSRSDAVARARKLGLLEG